MGDEIWDGPRSVREDELMEALAPLGEEYCRKWSHVWRTDNLHNVFIIKVGGKMAHFTAMFTHEVLTGSGPVRVAGLNNVVTHPGFRRQGLGSRMMEHCLERMRAQGIHVGLLLPSVPDWYRKFGWEYACGEARYFVDRANVELLPDPADLEIRVASADDQDRVPQLLSCYPGGGRTAKIDRMILDGRRSTTVTLVAAKRDDLAAFVRVEDSTVAEHGGDALAVGALVRAALARLHDPDAPTTELDEAGVARHSSSLTVRAPAFDTDLSRLFAARGIPSSFWYLGLLRIIDAQGLLAQFGVHDIEVLEDAGEFALTCGHEQEAFDARRLAKLIFGPERISDFAGKVLPVPFYVWKWDKV